MFTPRSDIFTAMELSQNTFPSCDNYQNS